MLDSPSHLTLLRFHSAFFFPSLAMVPSPPILMPIAGELRALPSFLAEVNGFERAFPFSEPDILVGEAPLYTLP